MTTISGDMRPDLQRAGVEAKADFVWTFSDVEFDEARWELKHRGVVIELQPKPLEVLQLLMQHAGEVMTKEELLDAVWPGMVVVEKVLTNAIGKLRQAIGDHDQSLIETVHRIGYRFTAAVTRKASAPLSPSRLALQCGDGVPHRPQWRLLRQLGASAGRDVWLAEHERNRARRVFKFSADGLHLPSLKREATLSRVLKESLGERPDMVRVLEWNFEEAPYFLECEFGGESWCDFAERIGGLGRLPLAERLELFRRAAEAVAAAHSVGVLHKDIKPANLLVEERLDNSGALVRQVRITDFGSGRLLEPGRLSELGITHLGFTQTQSIAADSRSGTPLYLAPEVLAGQLPTQSADVYALGVLLYQMVVGDLKRPISPGWELDVVDPLLRQDIAAAAHGDPTQRLQSAHELAERLRLLEQRASDMAQQEAQRLRTERLLRELELARARKPWIVAAGISLLLGIAVGGLYLERALRAESLAEAQRQRAEAIGEFLDEDLLSAADPMLTGRSDVTVLDAVRRSAGEVNHRFAASPDLAAAAHQALARAFSDVGEEKSAAAESDQAARLYLQLQGPASQDAVRARVEQALSLSASGAAQPAQAVLDTLDHELTAQRRLTPELQTLLLGARASLAVQAGDYVDARKQAERAMALADQVAASRPELLRYDAGLFSRFRKDYAFALGQTGDAAKAESVMREVLKLDQQRLGTEHAQVLVDWVHLAQALDAETPPKPEGEQILRRIEPKVEQTLGPDNPYRELIFGELGSIAMQRKDWSAAIDAFNVSYQQTRRLHGDVHQHTVAEAFNLGLAYQHAGQLTKAIEILHEAQANALKLFGAEGPLPQLIGYVLTDTLLRTGRTAEAQPLVAQLSSEPLASAEPDNDWAARLPLLRTELAYGQAHTRLNAQRLEEAIQTMAASRDDEHEDLVEQAQRQLGGILGGSP